MSVYVDLIRNNLDYRRLWIARVISNFGDWFNLLASAALITSLTGSGAAVSYLFLARFLPVFLMSPFAGVLADRYERRLIMAATDVARGDGALFFVDPHAGPARLLYFLTVIQFVLSSLYTPAHSALLPSLVAPEELVTANALDSFTWSTMLALGSLFGGLAAAAFGLAAAFTIDAFTFLLSAWFVLRIGSVPNVGTEHVRQAGLLDFMDGLRYLRLRRFILVLSLVKAAGALVWGAINVLEIPLAQQVFPVNGSGTITLGIIYAATGLGTGVGPMAARRLIGDSREASLRAISLSFLFLTGGVLLLGLAPTLAWVVVATLMRSLGTGLMWVFTSTLLQSLVENRFRGRVFAFEFAVMTLMQSISTLWAGVAYDRWALSVQSVFVLTSIISLAVSLAWLLFRLRTAQRVPSIA